MKIKIFFFLIKIFDKLVHEIKYTNTDLKQARLTVSQMKRSLIKQKTEIMKTL
jgi:hypothetical protein